LEIVRCTGEERTLDEILYLLRRHVAVAEEDVDRCVVGHDRVERAGMLIGVELNEDLLHASSSGTCSVLGIHPGAGSAASRSAGARGGCRRLR